MPIFLTVTNLNNGQASTDDRWTSVSGAGIALRNCKPPKTTLNQKTTLGPIRLSGAVESDRQYVIDWYRDTVERKGRDVFRDISISVVGADGSDLYTINYLECFLSQYTLTPLNANEDNEEVTETIEIIPGYSDNLLG